MEKKKIKIKDRELEVWVARTMGEKQRGVSILNSLERTGMLFEFKIPMRYGFWMKGVKFPIDIIWLRKNKIVGITEDVPIGNGFSLLSLKAYYPPSPIDAALELASGAAAEMGLGVGDRMERK
ncbi:MAG: DUF192 domain-containing protein [Patescibacteria group bacterium]|nr:DUF192 domain-containing protein [Patescibacteria group bacterium]